MTHDPRDLAAADQDLAATEHTLNQLIALIQHFADTQDWPDCRTEQVAATMAILAQASPVTTLAIAATAICRLAQDNYLT